MLTLARQLIRTDFDGLNAAVRDLKPRRIAQACGLIVIGGGLYGFTLGLWRDPLMGF
ncbi:MAG: hypothetical protein ACFB21_13600 [Opitutales bacterium]